jgi:hypothetical protein
VVQKKPRSEQSPERSVASKASSPHNSSSTKTTSSFAPSFCAKNKLPALYRRQQIVVKEGKRKASVFSKD